MEKSFFILWIKKEKSLIESLGKRRKPLICFLVSALCVLLLVVKFIFFLFVFSFIGKDESEKPFLLVGNFKKMVESQLSLEMNKFLIKKIPVMSG